MSTETRVTETEYVKILRQKLGEFMLTMIDLHQRGVRIMKCTFDQDCIRSLIDAIKDEGKGKAQGHIGNVFNKGNEHEQFYTNMTTRLENNSLTKDDYDLLKRFIILIINSNKFNSQIEIRLLNVLLHNNGFPCRFVIKTIYKTKNASNVYNRNYLDNPLLYEMHMKLGDVSGNNTNAPNHYTVEISEDLQNKLTKSSNYTVTDGKIQIETDGDCFYTAVAVWCKIYGITKEHLNSLTYNVPFDFSEEHFKMNLKVPSLIEDIPIPEPIEFPTNLEFIKKDAFKIAQNMKNKIQNTDFNPTFEEKIIDENHTEYKNYDGLKKDNGTHCNKYKGNQKTKVEVAE
jgi:hypothetical protein